MLYVLDLDDTLYLERNYVRSGFRVLDQWLVNEFNTSGFFERAWEFFENGTRGNIFDLVLTDLNFYDEGLVKKLVQIYRSHRPDIFLEPDAFEFISNHCDDRLGIITDGYACAQWAKIRSLGLEERIEDIVVTDDWGKDFWKPNPRAFRYIQRTFLPEDCVYIADNPLKDFKAPAELGWMPSIRIRRKGSLHFELETPKSCLEIESFSQLPF